MYLSLFPRDVFAEMDRLQRDMQQAFDRSPWPRRWKSSFPPLRASTR